MAEWNTFEQVVEAPSKDKDRMLRFGISKEFVDTNLAVRKLTPIYQLHAHDLGQLPPINLVSELKPAPELTTLKDSLALFEGVKRPHVDENDGASVLVYVLKPKITIEWAATMKVMAQTVFPPTNSTFTALVRTDLELQDKQGPIHGLVTRVEWTLTNSPDLFLPKNYDTRYDTRHW